MPIPSDNLTAVTGYRAWFIDRGDEAFGLPIVALEHHVVDYGPGETGDGILVSEWRPIVITAGGSVLRLDDAESVPALADGVFVGVAPASMSQEKALHWLENDRVATPGPDHPRLGNVDDEDMVGRVTSARMRLNRRRPSAPDMSAGLTELQLDATAYVKALEDGDVTQQLEIAAKYEGDEKDKLLFEVGIIARDERAYGPDPLPL